MKKNGTILFFISCSVAAIIATGGTLCWYLYHATLEDERASLIEAVKTQAHLIEAVARFDAVHSQNDHPQGAAGATLSQVIDAQSYFRSSHKTSEYTVAKREAGQIVFLSSLRGGAEDSSRSVPWDGELAEPMRRALSGLSGSMVGLDYRGEIVLAAYETIPTLNVGVVGKIDMAEIREPFVMVGMAGGVGAIFVIGLGSVLYLYLTRSMRHQLRLERKLRDIEARQNARLEELVDARTAELRQTQERLVKQEGLATLGRLAATVSHELRNPLGAMSTSLMLVDAKVRGHEPGLERALDRMKRSIARCDRIVGEMLDFARDRNLALAPTIIDTWVARALDEEELPDGITLRYRLNGSGSMVDLDQELFRQVIINLFSNACDAMLGGPNQREMGRKGEVVIETRCVGDCMEIVVADNGPGIPDEALPSIFEPLFSTKTFGVGLGLPIVKKIVEQHGGTISIANDATAGVRVTLRIPLRQAGAKACRVA